MPDLEAPLPPLPKVFFIVPEKCALYTDCGNAAEVFLFYPEATFEHPMPLFLCRPCAEGIVNRTLWKDFGDETFTMMEGRRMARGQVTIEVSDADLKRHLEER